ncbi:xanthine dehydrogenase/oxidase-like [Diadema setosum]|uniref:xanthine dehydrogenase/oxidase-like n=1 Tax=Diadema setosum TaxID=31175 RepID=UPI003B3A7D2B
MPEYGGCELKFFCNGRKIVEKDADPQMNLATYLRGKLRLCGTKVGCSEGGCGACTVMVSDVHPQTRAVRHKSVMACLTPICLLHGKAVTTIEGIGSARTRLHAVQERLAKSHGSQCGFCSPGMVMSMYALLRSNPSPSVQDILRHLEGNLCRCTGYRAILDGFKSFCGENCCQVTGGPCKSTLPAQDSNMEENTDFQPYDSTQEPIFPPELLTDYDEYNRTATFTKGRFTWTLASSLTELLRIKADDPSIIMIAGNTMMGVEKTRDGVELLCVVSPGNGITELTKVTTSDTGVTIGSGVTVTELERILKEVVDRYPEYQTRSASAILEILRWFGGQQIRNMATIGPSVAAASGVMDLSVVLMATKTTVTLVKAGDCRRIVPFNIDFFPTPDETLIDRDEIVESLHIPFTDKNDYVFAQKIAPRHHCSLAGVTCGFRVTLNPEGPKVKDLLLAFGGVDSQVVLAVKTSNSLIGQTWNQSLLQDALNSISSEVHPAPHMMGLSAEYRQSLMETCFLRFYVSVSRQINIKEALTGPYAQGQLSEPSLLPSYNEDGPVSTQVYQPPPLDQPDADPLGRPVVHLSALRQCSGEAAYCDDIPPQTDELHLAPVISSRAHARIIAVDASRALALDGVVSYLSHSDIPATNSIDEEEEIFATTEVHCIGQPIGAIVALSHELAVKAARLVDVQYEDLQPVILTLQEAIKEGSLFDTVTEFAKGDLEESFGHSEEILEGSFEVGGQEHLYLETHTCVARPGEGDEVEVHASLQALDLLQKAVAKAIGVPRNCISCHAKRIGGGFGGKADKVGLFIACCVAAKKLHRPVRMQLERTDDVIITGGRHPFHLDYRVGYNRNGRILAVDAKLYGDGGHMDQCTKWVVRQAIVTFDSVYQFPGYRVTGYACRTNKPPNTAFRGFGAPQGLTAIEHILTEVAMETGISQRKVREMNFRPQGYCVVEGDTPLDMASFRECWDTCLRQMDYENRLERVEEFNRQNTWRKRGIAILPTKHGIGMFGNNTMNQGAALVHIYTDGSVLVNHGGIEMGQGLNTKVVQVASKVLGIPVKRISTSASATDKVPNPTGTGGSSGTDLYGGAVKAACETLLERLEPFRASNPKGSWEEWVQAAYTDRISLSATGFYKRPGGTFDYGTMKGSFYLYSTTGVGISEVEVDILTGQHQLLSTDIVMDVGKSINPTIDIGQIEGGFVQGYGYFTMEEKKFTSEGALINLGPSLYKIPTARDVPKQFNVTLLRNRKILEDTLYSSKGIGEPAFFLGASAFFAIKHALTSSRRDRRLHGRFVFNAPATIENICMTCQDSSSTP